MPSLRRTQQTILSSVGAAGAVLAAVVVTFALASGIVAYSLTSVDPLPRPSGALVLAPLGPGVTAAKPLVLRRAPAATATRRSAPAAGAAGPASASTRDREAVAGAPPPQGGRGSGGKTGPQDGGDGAAAPAQPAPDRAAPQPLLAPIGDTVGATGQAVAETTDSLARRLDTVAAAVGTAGDLLRTTADGSGRVVGRLLGDSPRR
jgi:hypothetical protein